MISPHADTVQAFYRTPHPDGAPRCSGALLFEDVPDVRDELDWYIAGQMRDPAFARCWHEVCASMPDKLCIDGHEYRRRQRARRRRGRR